MLHAVLIKGENESELRPFQVHLIYLVRRMVRSVRSAGRRLIRRIRYGPMPSGGWGHGWRVLVFQYGDNHTEELHVLAPVAGDEFDWDLLRTHVRGKPWPPFQHELGRLTGVMEWAGHHLYVTANGDEPQRVSMGKLVPGEFRGGVGRSLLLVEVRYARIESS